MRAKRRGMLLAALLGLTLAAGAAMNPPAKTPPAGGSDGSVRNGAVELGATLDRHSVLAGSDGTVRVELEITGDEPSFADQPVRTPTDLLVILDRSGSMQGEALEFAKAAIFELITQLEREDRFGLVTYATGGEVAIGLEAATDVEKSRWHRVVRAVHANGGTNMALGLDLAHQVVTEAKSSGRAPRVILISDGHANQGDHSVEGLRARAARAIQEEYVLTTVGVAQGFDENVMSTVADAGTGNFYYLPSLRALAGVFADEFASARERVASALEVLLRPGDGVQVLEAAGLPFEKTQDGVRFHPGDLFAGQQRRIWLTLRTPTRNLGELALGRVSLRFTDSDGERRDLELGELPQIACVAAEADYYASFAPDVYRRGSRSEAIGSLKQRVAGHMKAGRQAEAVAEVETHLKEMKTEQLRALGYVVSEDLDSAHALRDRVATPSAAEPEMQNLLGKSLLEEGRDERRVGSKRK